jgi:hypothetical protein
LGILRCSRTHTTPPDAVFRTHRNVLGDRLMELNSKKNIYIKRVQSTFTTDISRLSIQRASIQSGNHSGLSISDKPRILHQTIQNGFYALAQTVCPYVTHPISLSHCPPFYPNHHQSKFYFSINFFNIIREVALTAMQSRSTKRSSPCPARPRKMARTIKQL